MLRADLIPLEVYLADALLLGEDRFLARHPTPVLVVPEPRLEVLRQLARPDTLAPGAPIPALYDLIDPYGEQAVAAALDALVLVLRPKDGESHDRITLGRAPEADIVLLDETVSKLHAELSWDEARGRCLLSDLGSKNGTFVDGERLPAGIIAEVDVGGALCFGSLLTRFYPPRAFLAWLSTGLARAGAPPRRT